MVTSDIGMLLGFKGFNCLLWVFRNLEIGQLSDEHKLSVCMDAGCVLLKDTNTVYDETNTEIYTIKEGEPTTAKVTIQPGYYEKRMRIR